MSIHAALGLDDEEFLLDDIGDELVVYNNSPVFAVVDYTSQSIINQDSYFVSPEIHVIGLIRDFPGVRRGSVIMHDKKKLVVDQVIQNNSIHNVMVCRDGTSTC